VVLASGDMSLKRLPNPFFVLFYLSLYPSAGFLHVSPLSIKSFLQFLLIGVGDFVTRGDQSGLGSIENGAFACKSQPTST